MNRPTDLTFSGLVRQRVRPSQAASFMGLIKFGTIVAGMLEPPRCLDPPTKAAFSIGS